MLVEVASIVFIVSIAICTACLAVIALVRLSNHRRVGRHPKANSITKFTPEIKVRTRPDEMAPRERELQKWREEHKAQLERE
jgi:hypothetical protein